MFNSFNLMIIYKSFENNFYDYFINSLSKYSLRCKKVGQIFFFFLTTVDVVPGWHVTLHISLNSPSPHAFPAIKRAKSSLEELNGLIRDQYLVSLVNSPVLLCGLLLLVSKIVDDVWTLLGQWQPNKLLINPLSYNHHLSVNKLKNSLHSPSEVLYS